MTAAKRKRTEAKVWELTRQRLEPEWIVECVECKNGRVSRDLFGCIDALAFRDEEVMALQLTANGNGPARAKKITENCEDGLFAMRACGWAIKVWDWRKRASGEWELVEVDLS